MLKLVTDTEIYTRVICEAVPRTRNFLWIATADLKDLYVDKKGRVVPFLEILSDLVGKHVEVRLLHAKEPGWRFKRDFDKYRNLRDGVEMMLCPRVHLKCVVVDGEFAYIGSANLTGAGMGAKSSGRRNFEAGIITDDKGLVAKVMDQFDEIWRGGHCPACRRKSFCSERPGELLE